VWDQELGDALREVLRCEKERIQRVVDQAVVRVELLAGCGIREGNHLAR